MTAWRAGLSLLVAGCLHAGYFRFCNFRYAVGCRRAPYGGGRRSFGHSVGVGLALTAPARAGCPISKASGGLCAGERGQAPWACRAVLCGNAG